MGSITCISQFGLGYQSDSSGHNHTYCLQFLCLSYVDALCAVHIVFVRCFLLDALEMPLHDLKQLYRNCDALCDQMS